MYLRIYKAGIIEVGLVRKLVKANIDVTPGRRFEGEEGEVVLREQDFLRNGESWVSPWNIVA